MKRKHIETLSGIVLDDEVTFTMSEFCHVCGVETDFVLELVGEGVIEPTRATRGDYEFTGEALLRAKRAMRLVGDLDVNLPGAALALDLLDELERHQRRLAWYRDRVRRR